MAKKSILGKFKEIEHMIPYKFNFDFGFYNNAKETYQHKEHYYDERPDDIDYLHTGYEIYDYSNLNLYDGYMESDRWHNYETLELILEFRHLVFKDGRKYIIGKDRVNITDIISLFSYLKTAKNYAIFNNILNTMLIFIIDNNIKILEEKKVPTVADTIRKYFGEDIRKIYKVKQENNSVFLVNSFIYNIEKKDVHYSSKFDSDRVEYLNNNWNKSFEELIKLLQNYELKTPTNVINSSKLITLLQTYELKNKTNFIDFEELIKLLPYETKTSTSDTLKLEKLAMPFNKFEKEITKFANELTYNFKKVGINLIHSLQYQYIIDNIANYSSGISEINTVTIDGVKHNMVLIFTTSELFSHVPPIFTPKNGVETNIYFYQNDIYISYQNYKGGTSPTNVILLNKLIIYSNEHILKKLYLKIKTNIDSSHKSSSGSPPKSSPDSFGSIGSPPKGSPDSFGSIGSPPKGSIQLKRDTSLEYQFIMDNIDAFPSIGSKHNMKLIYTSKTYMNEIKGVFEAINYAKSSYENIEVYNDKIRDGQISIDINIYSKENKLYITYQIGDKYKRDPDIYNIMELNQQILFKNEHILEELYEYIKRIIKQQKGGKLIKKTFR